MKKSNGFTVFYSILGCCLTAATACATQQTPVALGSDSSFAVLAGTTVTVTGGGTITGNIGISPGTAFVAGIPAVTVNGTVYAGGPVAAQAQADLTVAFNDAAGRQTPVIVAGNIGGQTLAPGLYKSTSSLAVSSGDLTLDGQGNPNAVFIFQIGSTLTLTSGRQVILTGGANAANIFWQVGTSATLGTTSVIYGNILAAVSISTLTGATLHGRALAQGGAVSIDTGGGSSITVPVTPTSPTVTSTVPANGAVGVPVGNKLSAVFSTAMNPSTLTTSTFTLSQGAVSIPGVVSYSGTTATFSPVIALTALKSYSATITTGAHDQAGNALAANYVWTFTTGSAPDTTPPTVISSVPSNGASGVAIGSKLSAAFSEAMDPTTITAANFTLRQGAVSILGAVTYAGGIATFTPSISLTPLTVYTATIGTGVQDLAGNALAAAYVWSFTTSTVADTTPPTVTSTNPVNGATGVAVTGNIQVSFSEFIDPLTISTATFTLQQGATPIAGSVVYGGSALFTPAAPLAANTTYTGTVTTGVRDLAGNALATPYFWSFTTAVAPTAPPVIFPAGTVNNSTATVNLASYVSPVAAGSAAVVFGSNLATGQSSAALFQPLPLSLAQSSILIAGQPAPLYFVSQGQINVQIPWELAGQTQTTVSASVAGLTSNVQTISLAAFAPGIFTVDMSGTGQGAILIAPTAQVAAPGTPVLRGGYVAIFCTGLGSVTNRPATGIPALAVPLSLSLATPIVTIGGVPAPVTYSGLGPTLTGIYQVNALVPAGVSPGNSVPVSLSIGGAVSNTVTIAVQ